MGCLLLKYCKLYFVNPSVNFLAKLHSNETFFFLGTFSCFRSIGLTKNKDGVVSTSRSVFFAAISGAIGAFVGSPFYMVSVDCFLPSQILILKISPKVVGNSMFLVGAALCWSESEVFFNLFFSFLLTTLR